ncbi:MAG: HlyD family efflux transporter periplasmic adaptor subunit [Bdellovibrionales bacterium]|nr:HlyD family efflux transporter periplasmic adaptor subunit [Bdellovibrionales bacterium]
MRDQLKLTFIILSFFGTISSWAFVERAPVYGVIKPKVITTLLAVNHGMVAGIQKNLGDPVKRGEVVLSVIEKETTRLYRTTIFGKVAKAHVTQGAAVTPGMPLMTILDPSKKQIEVSLSPDEASKVHIGAQVQQKGSEDLFGIVEKISPLVDPDTGAVIAYVQPKRPVRKLIGDVLPLLISLRKIANCKIVKISEINRYSQDYKVEATSGSDVCLVLRTQVTE